ncbi:MFS transporter [Pararhizobium polonicum]|uniref:MFS transporter n=1 Tax=Pararhizobium polonicum TaxID=1612624 RepID=A0A1C7NWH7_9HYPH|nr:MFS transporter [Pararhizobium polonicum]OBZ93363.1 MFS transporter [Pararhizobium polonicum]
MTGGAERSAGWGELLQPRYLASIITLCLGVALFAFNEFFISTALPTAVEELGGAALLSWAFTLYLVFAIIGGLVAANLKQRFGARNTLLAAATVFVAGTVLATCATDMMQVLGGRLLQGAGEGIVAALCYALIPELFPSRLVPKVFGAEAIVWAMAAFSGPLVAGGLTEHFSWRAAFFVSIPAAAIFIALVLAIVPRGVSGSGQVSPIPFARLAAAGAGILMISLSGIAGGAAFMASLLAGAAVVLVAVVCLDRRSANPVLPGAAFTVRKALGTGLWVILLMPLAQAAGSVFLVYSLQHLWRLGPTAAGALSAVMAISWSLSAIGVATLRSLALRNRIMLMGPVLLLAGLAAVMIAIATGTLWLVLPGQVMIGAGFGISWGTLSQLMMDVSTDAERDRTSAMLPTLQSAGYAIGAAVFGLVANIMGFGAAASEATMRNAMLLVFATGCAVAATAVLFALRTARLARTEAKF